jgi:diguanylate cyclase (GGDEF)-like protein
MADHRKIGIVWRNRPIQFFLETVREATPWVFAYFQESAVLHEMISIERDYTAVFFPLDGETSGIRCQLSNLFPGAEIVGYRTFEKSQDGAGTQDACGLLAVCLPMEPGLGRHLLESLSAARIHKKELAFVQRRADNLRDLYEAFANTIEASSNADDRKLGMSLFINKLLSHVRAEECILYLFGEGSASLQRAYTTGNIRDIELFEQHANSTIVEKCLKSGSPYLNNNYSFELRVPFSKESSFIHSILCYPLLHRGERIGAIELLNKRDGGFTPDDQNLIERMLPPLAVAVRTVDLFESAERLTITDDLTKLYNYRYLMKYLEADVKRCLRYKKKVSLLFIDVDGFKRINDTFGHLVGSQALAEIGQVFKRIVRETDVVGRYGGDEFVIVLPETPLNGAMVIAERIRKKVEECEFVAHNLSIRLTVSLGVANCPKHTLTAEGLIKKADAAMYRAKELSKNSIKVAV